MILLGITIFSLHSSGALTINQSILTVQSDFILVIKHLFSTQYSAHLQ